MELNSEDNEGVNDLFSRKEVEQALGLLMSPEEVREAMEFIYETSGGLGYAAISDNFFDALASLSEDAARRVGQYRSAIKNRRPPFR